ncbi:hypothetical protein BH11ARM1_BH11ARM1_14280 [soil metagenome]
MESPIDAFEETGRALQERKPVPYFSAASYASSILSVLNGPITSAVFQTDDAESEVGESSSPEMLAIEVENRSGPIQQAFGALRGRVQAMTNRHGNRFTIYELITDRAVACYYDPSREGEVVAAYGKVAIIEGWIRRNPLTGLPTSIRGITKILAFDAVSRSDYQRARGAAPSHSEISPEAAIRRVRDG